MNEMKKKKKFERVIRPLKFVLTFSHKFLEIDLELILMCFLVASWGSLNEGEKKCFPLLLTSKEEKKVRRCWFCRPNSPCLSRNKKLPKRTADTRSSAERLFWICWILLFCGIGKQWAAGGRFDACNRSKCTALPSVLEHSHFWQLTLVGQNLTADDGKGACHL